MSITMEKSLDGARVIYNASKTVRWIDVIGETVVKHVLNPGQSVPVDDTTGDPTEYIMTPIETGLGGDSIVVNSEAIAEALLFTTDNAEYDGINLQAKNVVFKCEADKPMYFGIKCLASEATNLDMLVGLAIKKTDPLNESGSHAVNAAVEGIFFLKLDGATLLQFQVYKNGVLTNTADYETAMGVIAAIYEFYWDGTVLKGYIDNNLVATFTHGMPDTEIVPTVNVRAGSAHARTLKVHWMRAFEIRV